MHLWRVEFHCHTCYSPDCLVTPRALVQRARELGLDRIVITDHNTIRGALEAQALAPDLVIVILGWGVLADQTLTASGKWGVSLLCSPRSMTRTRYAQPYSKRALRAATVPRGCT